MTAAVRSPMWVTYRPDGLFSGLREVPVVEELEPVGYLRVFRRPNGTFLHVFRDDVRSVNGRLQ